MPNEPDNADRKFRRVENQVSAHDKRLEDIERKLGDGAGEDLILQTLHRQIDELSALGSSPKVQESVDLPNEFDNSVASMLSRLEKLEATYLP